MGTKDNPIAKLLRTLNMRGSALAAELGVSRSVVSNWATGENGPNRPATVRLTTFLKEKRGWSDDDVRALLGDLAEFFSRPLVERRVSPTDRSVAMGVAC